MWRMSVLEVMVFYFRLVIVRKSMGLHIELNVWDL
jgi:hypothetical protein